MASIHATVGRLGQAAMNWNLFVGAAILVGGLLLKLGAPLPALVAGIGLAAIVNWTRARGATPRGPRDSL